MPLLVDKAQWFPSGTPKALFIIGGTLLMVVLWVWGRIRSSQDSVWTFSPSWLHLVLILYFLVLTLSALFGSDPANSFFGRYELSLSLVLLYALGLLAGLVGFLVSRKKMFLTNILLTSFLSGILVAVVSFFDKNSTLGNDSYVGGYLLFNLCFGLALFFTVSRKWRRGLIALGTLVISLSPVFLNPEIWQGKFSILYELHHPLSILGSAMGATIGVAVAVFLSVSLWIFAHRQKFMKAVGTGLFVFFIISFFLVAYSLLTPGGVVNKVYVAEKTASRFIFWDIANSGFIDRPLLGWGYGNYSDIYQKYFNPQIMSPKYTEEEWVSQPHNVVYEYLSTTGILGTLAFFLLFGLLLFVLFKNGLDEEGKPKAIPMLLFGALVGYFIQNLFVFDSIATYLMFFLVLGVVLPRAPILRTITLNNKTLKMLVVFFVLVSSAVCLVVFVFYPWQESQAWKNLVTTTNISEIANATYGVQEISIMGNIRDTAYLYDTFFNLIEGSLAKVNASNKIYVLKTIDALSLELDHELTQDPNYFRANFVAGKLLNLRLVVDGKPDSATSAKADAYLEVARGQSPNNPIIYLALAQSRFIENNIKEAEGYTKAAIALAPEYQSSYDFANNLMKVHPDNKFEDYLKFMQSKWSPR